MIKKYYITPILSTFPIQTLAHSGHPEDQVINGIDNQLLVYGSLAIILVLVIIIGWFQGKKQRSIQVKE